jgi:hypothetical protein
MGFILNLEGQPVSFGSWLGLSLFQMILCLLTAWDQCYKTFYTLYLLVFYNELQCLSPAILSSLV